MAVRLAALHTGRALLIFYKAISNLNVKRADINLLEAGINRIQIKDIISTKRDYDRVSIGCRYFIPQMQCRRYVCTIVVAMDIPYGAITELSKTFHNLWNLDGGQSTANCINIELSIHGNQE
jgi:hypothetical protein